MIFYLIKYISKFKSVRHWGNVVCKASSWNTLDEWHHCRQNPLPFSQLSLLWHWKGFSYWSVSLKYWIQFFLAYMILFHTYVYPDHPFSSLPLITVKLLKFCLNLFSLNSSFLDPQLRSESKYFQKIKSQCLSQCCIAVKGHHDQGNSYKRAHEALVFFRLFLFLDAVWEFHKTVDSFIFLF